jgi:ninein-like protein
VTEGLILHNRNPFTFRPSDMTAGVHAVFCVWNLTPGDQIPCRSHGGFFERLEALGLGHRKPAERGVRWLEQEPCGLFFPERKGLGLELAEPEVCDSCFCRREAEDELSHKLSWLEAQHAAHCESLSLRHQCEKDQLLQTHLRQARELAVQLHLEKGQREEREKEILARCQRQQLKLQVVMSEEQAQICRSFALEKEKLEHSYREQVVGLAKEAEALRALLKDGTTGVDSQLEGAHSLKFLCPDSGEQPPVQLATGAGEEMGNVPCSVDAMQNPALALVSTESPILLENHEGPLNAEEVASVPLDRRSHMQPHGANEGAISEDTASSSGAPTSLSLPDVQELPLLGTEGDASLAHLQLSPAALEERDQSLSRELAPGGGQEQDLKEPASSAEGALETGIQLGGEAARMGPFLPCSELSDPQEAVPERLATLEKTEAEMMLEREKNDMETKLLQLEDVVQVLEKEAYSRENNRCGLSHS